jgi:hypothetical protein
MPVPGHAQARRDARFQDVKVATYAKGAVGCHNHGNKRVRCLGLRWLMGTLGCPGCLGIDSGGADAARPVWG